MLNLKVTTCQESHMQCTLGTRWCTDTSHQRQFRAKTLLHQCHPCGSPLNTGIHLEQCPLNTILCMQVATIWPLFNPCQYSFCVSVHYYVEEIRNNQSVPLLVFGWRIFIFIVTNMLMSCTSYNIDCCFSIVMRVMHFCSYWKAMGQSIAASVKALEERQERILSRLHQLQLKVKKMIDDDVSKSVLQTSHVSILWTLC